MLWSIFEPFSYTVRHEFSNDGYGDLKNLDKTGLKAEYVEMAIVGHAITVAWRLWSKKEVPLFFKITGEEIGVVFKRQW